MEPGTAGARVAEWKQRKAAHAADPLEAAAAAQPAQRPQPPSAQCFVARVGGVVVARSANVQRANRRVYFPIAHCVASTLVPSTKRWR
jgi:hypothetical protein